MSLLPARRGPSAGQLPVLLALALPALALLAACSGSGSSGAPVLASARIGSAGGVLTVYDGAQAGLVLIVPPGVVASETEFRVLDETGRLPPELRATSYPAPAGVPFRIEPADLVLPENATLIMPYLPGNLTYVRAPGNVGVRQVNPYALRSLEPFDVDVERALVEVKTKTFGSFQVMPGPLVSSYFDYLPAEDEVVTLTGGYEFVITPAVPPSPFAAQGARLWAVSGPGIAEAVVFSGFDVVGREQLAGGWREVWVQQCTPWEFVAVPPPPLATTMQVYAPASAPVALGATLTCSGYLRFAWPRQFDGRQVRDVVELTIDVTYNRPDIGVGTRDLRLWFGADEGLLAMSIDGVVVERVP